MSDYFCTGMQRQDNNDCRDNDRDNDRCDHRDNDRDDCRENNRCDRRDNNRCDRCDNDRDDRRENCRDERREECPCRRGLVQALQTLLRTGLTNLVDFQSFAFVTKHFLVGSPLVCVETGTAAYDNLSDDLTATFSRFTPCACDFIDVTGPVYLPNIECPGTGLTISRLNLCDILAVAFGVLGDTDEETAENYQRAKQLLRRFLQPNCCDNCPPFPDPCDERFHCDCEDEHMPGGSTSLIVGDLLVANVTVLGKVGRVLVLANDADQRFYFVCTDKAVFVR